MLLCQSCYAENKIYKVLPQNNYVIVYYDTYENGQKTGYGGTRSHQGNLVNWTENTVTTNLNGNIRTFNSEGKTISWYKQ